ncbi:acyltransferase family protein [Bifidobacterium sp. CP2]|uniref:acyltransferase family protein n=1 Tax=Bifidobacterium sp. CP2 TaxID=2809025 RepID=UPI001BDD0F56|nr:acyltransferase family protein [Bifidobacterium sp. CP2]MBT1180856.1 acyltransferase family protein [Bifidobacterium sp. CP2]
MPKRRNSSLELLRLLAMLAIVFHHAIVHNGDGLDMIDSVPSRVFLEFAGILVGKTAVCLFFIISIWFLADRQLTFRGSCRRVWILEREILFYSVLCYLVCAPMLGTFSPTTFAARLFPVITGEWWFVSDYVLLILALPFLVTVLKALPAHEHGVLAIFLAVFFGFVQYLPYVGWALKDSSDIMGLLALATLTCYIRWYACRTQRPSSCVLLVAGALSLALLILLYVLRMDVRIAGRLWTPMQDWHSLPVIVLSFVIFLGVNRLTPHHWPIIDRMASGTFAIYLITDTPEAEFLLWTKLFPLHRIADTPMPIAIITLISIGLYTACIGIDLIRQTLFRATIDRNPGAWFDIIAPQSFERHGAS